MGNLAIKGQDVEVLVVAGGQVQSQLTDIQSFDFTQETATLEENYLGEKAARYDDIYNGFSFSMDLHNSNPGLLSLLQVIQERAQRRTPLVQINVKATLSFPSGVRVRVILNDVFFDAAGLAFGGRAEYGTTALTGKGTSFRVLA